MVDGPASGVFALARDDAGSTARPTGHSAAAGARGRRPWSWLRGGAEGARGEAGDDVGNGGAAGAGGAGHKPVPGWTAPPPPSTSFLTWTGLAACLILACPALLVFIATPDVTEPAEAEQLAISMHTTERFNSSAPNWLAPHFGDQPRLERMPGITWAHMLGMTHLDPQAPAQGLIIIGRLVSALMALVAVAGVFWAAHSIAGPRAALLGGLVMAANPLLIYHGRLGTEASAYLGLYAVSVAAALWAIRPLKPGPSVERQFIGWVVCGLALGLALLVAGPRALPIIVVPILALLIICPGRVGHLLGLVAALLIGVLMVLPWAVYVYENLPAPWAMWFRPFHSSESPGIGGFFGQLGILLGVGALALLPWTFWLIAAAMQPLSRSSSGARMRLMLGWAWLAALVLVLVWIPGARSLGDILPLLPAAVVLLVSVASLQVDLVEVGHKPVSWRGLRWGYWGLLAGLSLLVPLGLLFHGDLVAGGWLATAWVDDWHLGSTAGLAVVLGGIVALTLPWVRHHHPGRAYVAWAVWSLVVSTALAVSIAHGPQAAGQIRPLSQQVHRVGNDAHPLVWHGPITAELSAMSLYSRRAIPVLDEVQLVQAAREHRLVLVLIPDIADDGEALLDASRLEVDRSRWSAQLVSAGEGAGVALWRLGLDR